MRYFNFLKEVGIKKFLILFAVTIITATFSTKIFGQDIGWDQYADNPIIKPDSSGWNKGMVSNPVVIMFKDTLRMWYTGSTRYGFDGIINIGYAWSLDGITWQQYSENPVLSAQQGEWDYPHIVVPLVIADGDTLRMWYGGGTLTFGDAAHRDVMRIGYATSVDGINWNRYPDPVIEPPHPPAWDQDGVLPGGVIKEDGIYKMWFGGGVGPLGYAPATSKWSIGYATSSDCIHWDLLPDPVITHGDSSADFDETVAGHPYVIRTSSGYDMWYYGHSHTAVVKGKPQGKIGYASSSDGIIWTKYDKNPVLSPNSVSPQWTTGYYNPSVYFDGERFHMWFTGWDEFTHIIAIGYATSLLDTSHYPTGIEDDLLTHEPTKYNLANNYPNPFNPTTNIQFTVPKTTELRINVYTILGEKVLTAAEGNYKPGSYKVKINASGLPSGIYIYRLESDVFTSTKKMVYLK